MKHLIAIGIMVAALGVGTAVFAAEFQTADQLHLSEDKAINDNIYAAGNDVTIAADVYGDALVTGGSVLISGDVSQDVGVVAGEADLRGNVGEDVRIAGGSVKIGGRIGQDVVGVGGTIKILPGAVIGRDILLAGGVIVIDGNIVGNVDLVGSEITINGTVNGNVQIRASQQVTLGDHALINGNFVYRAPQQANIATAATINGTTDYTKEEFRHHAGKKSIAGIIGVFAIFKLISLLIAGVLAVTFLKQTTHRSVTIALNDGLRMLGYGLIVLIVTPFVIALLFISVFGFWLALMGLLLYLLLLMVSAVFAGIIFGGLVLKYISPSADAEVDWKTVLIGTILLFLISLIPILGWLIALIFFLVALGSIVYMKHAIAPKG